MADLKTDVGIHTLQDLISWFPRRYEDRTEIRRISELTPGETACVAAMIAAPPAVSHIRKGLDLVKVQAVDNTGVLEITFFNQSWLKSSLHEGETYVFCGKAEGNLFRRRMAGPIEEPEGRREATGRIVPIYPLTAGVSQLILSRSIRQGLDACTDILPDVLPNEIRREHALCHIGFAYENIHFPESTEALALARRRLAFEELFFFTLGLRQLRQRRDTVKTHFCAKNGKQAALMAPTEILARQHYESLSPLMEPLGVHCALLTGSTAAKEKKDIAARLAAGEIGFVIGTHALITGDVEYARLGLVVTDEQHRFGVAQRAALAGKGEHPHVLVMSATPIPRTLALILYGDLDVSVIDRLPPGRRPVQTSFVSSRYHPRIYKFLRKLVNEGRQAYIVCPQVSQGEDPGDDRKAVTEYAAMLQQNIFPDLRIAFVHGKMKSREKEAVMDAFAQGKTDILVSTTVIEVGVDVPNAAVMVIENAERFGLSQLHQLRGRVGRGSHQSYCILISDNQNEETCRRLKVMTETADGFQIAEEDLRLRGPGDFFGERQHGLPGLRVADIGCDTHLLQEAQKAADSLLARDPELKNNPAAAERMAELFAEAALTFS